MHDPRIVVGGLCALAACAPVVDTTLPGPLPDSGSVVVAAKAGASLSIQVVDPAAIEKGLRIVRDGQLEEVLVFVYGARELPIGPLAPTSDGSGHRLPPPDQRWKLSAGTATWEGIGDAADWLSPLRFPGLDPTISIVDEIDLAGLFAGVRIAKLTGLHALSDEELLVLTQTSTGITASDFLVVGPNPRHLGGSYEPATGLGALGGRIWTSDGQGQLLELDLSTGRLTASGTVSIGPPDRKLGAQLYFATARGDAALFVISSCGRVAHLRGGQGEAWAEWLGLSVAGPSPCLDYNRARITALDADTAASIGWDDAGVPVLAIHRGKSRPEAVRLPARGIKGIDRTATGEILLGVDREQELREVWAVNPADGVWRVVGPASHGAGSALLHVKEIKPGLVLYATTRSTVGLIEDGKEVATLELSERFLGCDLLVPWGEGRFAAAGRFSGARIAVLQVND